LKKNEDETTHLQKYWAYYFFILFEIGVILIYAFCVDYASFGQPKNASTNLEIANSKIQHTYPLFQDVHVMIFIGFGFLMTFLKHYSWTAVGVNFILGAWVIQIAIIFNKLWFMIAKNEWGKIEISMHTLLDADFTAGSILIAFGGVLGKLNFVQYMIMATLQAFFYSIAYGLGSGYLKAVDVGGSMFIHTFGAYFGLSVCLAIKGKVKDFEKCASNYNSNLFAFIGTIFLWMYWPSFNGAPQEGSAQFRAIVNTYLCLTASCLIVFILSPFLKDGKLHAEYVLNATLAGGVMIGNSADLIFQPWAAILIGFCSGIMSILGFHYINAFLHEKIGLHDTCGIHYLHGMTGFMGGIIGAIYAGTAKESELGDSLLILYPNRAKISANMQGCYQLAALAIVLAIAISSGFLTGLLLKLNIFSHIETAFDDREKWEIEDDEEKNHLNDKKIYDISSDKKTSKKANDQINAIEAEGYNKIATARSAQGEANNIEMNPIDSNQNLA